MFGLHLPRCLKSGGNNSIVVCWWQSNICLYLPSHKSHGPAQQPARQGQQHYFPLFQYFLKITPTTHKMNGNVSSLDHWKNRQSPRDSRNTMIAGVRGDVAVDHQHQCQCHWSEAGWLKVSKVMTPVLINPKTKAVAGVCCWLLDQNRDRSPRSVSLLQTQTVALLKAQNGVTAQQSSYGGVVRVPGRGGAPGQYRARARVNPAAGAVEGLEYRVAVAAHRLQPPPGARTVATLHHHGQQLRSDVHWSNVECLVSQLDPVSLHLTTHHLVQV